MSRTTFTLAAALALVLSTAGAAHAQWHTLAFGKYHCTVYGGVVVNGPEVGLTTEKGNVVDVVLDGSWEHWGDHYPSLLGVYKKRTPDIDYDLRTAAQGTLITLQLIYNHRPGYSQDATCQYQGQ